MEFKGNKLYVCQNCKGAFYTAQQKAEAVGMGFCNKCWDWIVNGNSPHCNYCGAKAEKIDIVKWEARRGNKIRFGAGRYLCFKCRNMLANNNNNNQ